MKFSSFKPVVFFIPLFLLLAGAPRVTAAETVDPKTEAKGPGVIPPLLENQLSKDLPTASVERYDWTENGELVVAIVLYGPKSGSFPLGHLSENEFDPTVIFNTKDSYVIDTRTEQILNSLKKIPSKPSFGRIKTAGVIKAGERMVFNGAYAKPELPPLKKDGKYEDYTFKLVLPCKIPPATFTIPCDLPPPPKS